MFYQPLASTLETASWVCKFCSSTGRRIIFTADHGSVTVGKVFMDLNLPPENEAHHRRKEGSNLLTDLVLLAPRSTRACSRSLSQLIPTYHSPSALERHCNSVGGWSDKWVDRQKEEGVSSLGFL